MQRRTTYEFVYFSADVLREAYRTLRSQVDSEGSPEFSESFEVNVGDSTWSQDSLEEFLADYRKGSREAYFYARSEARPAVQMIVSVFGSDDHRTTNVTVTAPTRAMIETVFDMFDRHVGDSRLPGNPHPARPTIFIGHGRSPLTGRNCGPATYPVGRGRSSRWLAAVCRLPTP